MAVTLWIPSGITSLFCDVRSGTKALLSEVDFAFPWPSTGFHAFVFINFMSLALNSIPSPPW